MRRITIVFVVLRIRARMLMGSRSVMVLWMIVPDVGVRVQRRHLGRGANEGKAGDDGDQPLHRASVWKQWCGGQTSGLLPGADVA